MYHYSIQLLGFKTLTNLSSFAATRSRHLKIEPTSISLRYSYIMSCKRHRSSSSFPVTEDKKDNKKPKLKISNSKRTDAKESDSESVEILSVKDDPSKIEDMTVQQLRMALRNAGMPVKGPKSELIASLKSFKARHLDAESSREAEEHVCSVHTEKTLLQTKGKRRMKPSRAKAESVTSDAITITTEENCQLTQKRTQTRRKISSPMPDAEPWTVLAHKKPQKSWIPYNPRTMRPPPLAEDTKFVKLMSWNVNGLRALLKLEGFSAVELAKRENFDVLCLQETKLQEKDVEAIKQCFIDGYENSFWTCSESKLGYSGTAIVSRMKPLSVSYGLGIADHDSEGRLVMAEFDSFYLINAYVPNSGDGLRRLSYRVEQWDSSLGNYMKELEKSKPVILTGDLNCAHQQIDIYNPAGNRRSAGFTDEERQSFETNFLSRGFVDTFRKQHPDTVAYTYWGYRHGARKTNKGWRLDYFLVSESIADWVHDSYIVPDFNGSDHCPIGLILKV